SVRALSCLRLRRSPAPRVGLCGGAGTARRHSPRRTARTPVELNASRLVVISHKECWPSSQSPTGYATDGGFPFQMQALSELFASTTLLIPSGDVRDQVGEI